MTRYLFMAAAVCIAWCALSTLAAAQDLPTVTAAAPRPPSAHHVITLPATLSPMERVQVQAKITGYIRDLHVDVGSRVKAGDVLAVIDVPEMVQQLKLAEARVAAARASVAKAQASATLRKVTHDRLSKLYAVEAGAVPQLDVEVAAAEHKAAEAEVGVARANIDVAAAEVGALKALLDYSQVRAPFNGVVTQRATDLGALVSAGGASARSIVELIRTDRLRLSCDVPERLLWCISPQQLVRYSVEAIPGRTVEGRVVRTSGAVDPRTRSMRVEIDVDNADGLLAPGMYATARFAISDLRNTAVVPATALRSAGGQSVIYAVNTQGLVKNVPVLVLLDDGKEAAVSGQLPPEHLVITASAGELQDGQRVQLRAETAAK